MDEHTTVGERIAYYRRRRGLTQQVLSGRVGRSPSWLVKIERGDRTVEAIKDLFALARVLKIKPGDLIGGFELPPNGGAPLDPPRGIHALSRALLALRPPDIDPPIPEELRGQVERIQLMHVVHGKYESVAHVLPGLIDAGRSAAAQDMPGAWWSLATAYRVASSLFRGLGEVDLAWIAADRAVTAAQRSGDVLQVALSEQLAANALMRRGWLDQAGGVLSDAVDAIAPADDTPPEGWSVWGTLHLTRAVTAVRGEDTAGAWGLLGDARIAAERVGPGRNDYCEAFGPANVGAIEVTVALESGDAVEALRIADTVEVEELPNAGRRARFLFDVGHAHVLRRDDGAAVAVLLEAERHAPEEMRYNVLAHEMVRVLLGRERRSRTPGLRGLAARLGLTDSYPSTTIPEQP